MAFGGSSFAAPMFAGGGMPSSTFGTGAIEDYQTNGIRSAVFTLAGAYGTTTDYATAGGTIIDRRSQ